MALIACSKCAYRVVDECCVKPPIFAGGMWRLPPADNGCSFGVSAHGPQDTRIAVVTKEETAEREAYETLGRATEDAIDRQPSVWVERFRQWGILLAKDTTRRPGKRVLTTLIAPYDALKALKKKHHPY